MGEEEPGAQRIEVEPNGPYQVRGGLPLFREEIVRSPEGDSVDWRRTEELPARQEYRLCRCGRSQNKPFCDDSHLLEPPFDGEERADRGLTDERRRFFRGHEIVMGDDVSLCASAAFCESRTEDVWSMLLSSRDPEIRERIKHRIRRCPSGRLTYVEPPDETAVEREYEPSIAVVRDGPLRLLGRVEVIAADGECWEVRNRMALCRCGVSENKPFCDGSHNVIEFRDPADDDDAIDGVTADVSADATD
ncbi:MAG: CDGSH iron-sulfur domain-containing protein [Actinomycetota bacterium]|nr:CDGSH iron-sulfur domain-containing protein [Actinomycetota bacterium]